MVLKIWWHGLFNYLNKLLIQEWVITSEADDHPSRAGRQGIYQFRIACFVWKSTHMIYIHPRGDPWFQEEFVMPGLAASTGRRSRHALITYITCKVHNCQVWCEDLGTLERSACSISDNQSGPDWEFLSYKRGTKWMSVTSPCPTYLWC